ncbi:hypothetical protein [Paenibacillus sp. CF384]|uniref:hypothetical protein n=1 Tax=Paenibacillus sp. CF384 TaxID=1884382 RepID=UPI00210ACD32|nr:hypothetical protein [Paenibacillus sp. CF384]
MMETIASSKVRDNWATTFDEAFYNGPKLIEKNDRINLLFSSPMIKELLRSNYKLIIYMEEEEGMYAVHLSGIKGTYGHGESVEEAIDNLVHHLTFLVEEMYSEFNRYVKERHNDIFYLLQISLMDKKELFELPVYKYLESEYLPHGVEENEVEAWIKNGGLIEAPTYRTVKDAMAALDRISDQNEIRR